MDVILLSAMFAKFQNLVSHLIIELSLFLIFIIFDNINIMKFL